MTKVCILTAGIGSRLLPLTEKINKAILPLGDMAIISHIIDKFPKCTEFIIATGYLHSTVEDYLALAHPDSFLKFVRIKNYSGEGAGPGYSLLQCEQFLREPFYFCSCDTIVEEDIPCENSEPGDWIAVSKTTDPESYCTVSLESDHVSEFYDKDPEGSPCAFIGLARIHNHKVFFEALKRSVMRVAGEPQITAGLEGLKENRKLKAIEFSWYDTGNKADYSAAQKHFSNGAFDFSKMDEHLYFKDDKVIKYFTNHTIAEKRFSRSKALAGYVPEVLEHRNGFYAYKFIDGQVLYDCDLKSAIEPLLNWLHKDFWLTKKLNINENLIFHDACAAFYRDKTYNRLEEFYVKENRNDFLCGSINGEHFPSVNSLLEIVEWTDLAKGIPVRFHGDLQFDNILITKDNNFKLIDWRQEFSGLIEYGDLYYDLSKLLGGIIIPYKYIKLGEFSFEFSGDGSNFRVPRIEHYEFVKKVLYQYLDIMGVDKKKVCIITSLIFLNMAPLHEYPFSHLLYLMGRKSLANSLNNVIL